MRSGVILYYVTILKIQIRKRNMEKQIRKKYWIESDMKNM